MLAAAVQDQDEALPDFDAESELPSDTAASPPRPEIPPFDLGVQQNAAAVSASAVSDESAEFQQEQQLIDDCQRNDPE